MKILKIALVFCLIFSCKSAINTTHNQSPGELKQNISDALDNWHKAAADANFNNYFELMTKDGVFLGTDATENWQNQEFKAFSKPYFDKGKAWSFTSVERNIYIYDNQKIAWFDELLDTQMKLCRGSGVMKLEDDGWKVAHYVLSITIPNDDVTDVVKLKTVSDSLYTRKLKLK
ncbi:nuclear transport factor 2 family protein [uncultured Lacinutrix sp.]|uniref:nuclear transport factor 2 family protein n=1 Tax=uncultured Lacinutrix sp. TaxID=574032 RepID=UPI0026119B6D|nr:nuclear transport factor 2 family protein [uncultured Lacinutrix sp.]